VTFGDIVEEKEKEEKEVLVVDAQELEVLQALLDSLELLGVMNDKEMSPPRLELADQAQHPHTDLGSVDPRTVESSGGQCVYARQLHH